MRRSPSAVRIAVPSTATAKAPPSATTSAQYGLDARLADPTE
jgi:hypothetical protein